MSEPLFSSTITAKLYNERAVLIGTFLGGPLVGGYLIAQNFKTLNEPAKAGRTWLITIAVMVFLVATFFVPVFDKIPSIAYSFAFCLAAHTITKNLQGSQIALHQTAGGAFYKTLRAALIGLLGCVLMLAGFLVLSYFVDQTV